MAVIAVKARVLKNALLKVDLDNYEKHVESVTLTPKTDQVTWTGLGGNVEVDNITTEWTLELGYAQDWETTNSLSQYLLANSGLTKTIEFTPFTGGKKATVTVLIQPGPMGGSVGQTAKATVTLAVVGQPTLA